jgi:nitrous oxide reductase accessory protein NosL
MSLLKSLFLLLLSFNLFASYPNYSEAIKEKKIYPMGEKIFAKKCSFIDVSDYKSYDALQKGIQESNCAGLSKRYQEALSLYLWDKKRVVSHTHKLYPELKVSHKQKCPVCGMFLYKYPRWVTMIEYSDGQKFYFDGLKDLFKYYFAHQDKPIKEMLTREYYTQKSIPLKEAYFVIGSDVYGPMGNELIAFKDESSAKNFLFDHRGKKIVRFNEVTKEMVYKLDE